MLAVTNPMLKRLVLEDIVERIDRGGIDSLLECGLTPDFIDMIRRRPARDLIHIASIGQLQINVSLEPGKVVSHLKQLDWLRQDAEIREYFIRNGATQRMLMRTFKISSADLRVLREQLLDGETVGGRTRMPEPDVRDAIHSEWARLQTAFEHEREQIYHLHQRFPDYTIAALASTLSEFDTE